MEDKINLKISANDIDTEIKIDNSTFLLEFNIEIEKDRVVKCLKILIDSDKKVLEIDGVKFNGITLELLKSFLNQLP